ncbi:MAG: succinate dehydrogenase, cytochrome b556 subunit [Bauldia sp.]
MAETTGGALRPMSPHLRIYRWSGTMAMSIAHRITGAALFIGMGLLAWWLVAAAIGPDAFATARRFLFSLPGTILVFAFSWSLIHHAVGGLRHLVWDAGVHMSRRNREFLAWGTLATSIALTAAIWALAYFAR